LPSSVCVHSFLWGARHQHGTQTYYWRALLKCRVPPAPNAPPNTLPAPNALPQKKQHRHGLQTDNGRQSSNRAALALALRWRSAPAWTTDTYCWPSLIVAFPLHTVHCHRRSKTGMDYRHTWSTEQQQSGPRAGAALALGTSIEYRHILLVILNCRVPLDSVHNLKPQTKQHRHGLQTNMVDRAATERPSRWRCAGARHQHGLQTHTAGHP
jgi:hypothetical protein